MSKEYTHAVFIGRFQPLHKQHFAVIEHALEVADNLIIVIGSIDTAPSVKNPWSYEERHEMILNCIKVEDRDRVHFVGVRDYFYSEPMWLSEVQSQVESIAGTDSERVCLIGHFKDHSSEYLNAFQQWDFIPAKDHEVINATDIRAALLAPPSWQEGWIDKWSDNLPTPIKDYLLKWTKKPIFEHLMEEYGVIENYKALWHQAPFPPVFVTTDAIVVKSGHVLVVTRRNAPGRGLWALPGGFLKEHKSLEQSAVRELKEETRIQVDVAVLQREIVAKDVFDYPDRDPRGRTITHAFLIDLGNGPLPKVRGGDDARRAAWIPIREVFEHPDRFYADHAHILYHFLMGKRWN